MTSPELALTPPLRVPFVLPYQTGAELKAMTVAMAQKRLAGDNAATRRAETYLREATGLSHALLTPSGTGALELMAILAGIEPGDEVVMPSFTFSSTANAVVLRGATPVFVDVRADTLNVDAELIRPALTERTRAIMVVHYAGVPCDMDPIYALARERNLPVLVDAAQALHATYRGSATAALGDMAAFSFHETKNVHCGEGGAFLCADDTLGRRAEIVREKGTNRAAFFRGDIDKYTWVDVGSSFLPSELNAAFLAVQLEASRDILDERLSLWRQYDEGLATLRDAGDVRLPSVPPDVGHNAHIYHLRLGSLEARTALVRRLRGDGIQVTSHYVPLHSSPAGRRFGRAVGELTETDRAGDCLIRLPLWCGLPPGDVDYVIGCVLAALG